MSDPLNPYAPPQVPDQIIAGGRAVGAARLYASTRGKAKAAVAVNVATLVMHLLLVISLGMQLSLLYGAKHGVQYSEAAGSANDVRQQMVAGFTILANVACLIMLLVWVYGANGNLRPLGARNPEFTPGWAVGWFFIPVANLWKPYQAVVELWHGSDPRPLGGQPAQGTSLIGWWWGLRIVSAITGRVLSSMTGKESTIDEFIGVSWAALIVTLLIDMPERIAETWLILTIQRFQEERYAILSKPTEPARPSSLTAPLSSFRDS